MVNIAPNPACTHPQFQHHVAVNRITADDTPAGPVTAFMADVHIWCADPPVGCGRPFQFLGLPFGLSYDHPMSSPNGTELRAPISPALA